ncbi:MAG: putative lipid II flippase FtsW [Candidatus Moranbacteria bacterium]|jgi:cell division protein FtsW|nr:putative lipid II flippase FtsW [Candidatus Moranbacteria bacterium]MDD5651786.1 putative lipid II flippase FtsW [Candidatus Moranbacteria bacterium]MDX9855803.1 putative lipid II flippase FtsW [Candidatus Moranbacteria bacterium]
MSNTKKQFDKTLLTLALTLAVFGLIMIASAGVLYSQTRFEDPNYFIKHQFLFGFIPGLFFLYLFSKIDYHFWKKFSIPFFFASLFALVLVFIPGIGSDIYGASRWINLGSISFQPSEMAKISIILYLAAWLENKGTEKIKDIYEGTIPFLTILAIAGFLIIRQPDTGTLGVIIMIAVSMYFVSGASVGHIFGIFLAGLAGLAALIMIAPYRMNRFLVFLNPEHDPQGVGYQINQALLAIGSGGIFGLGLGHSRQKFNYLPEPVGDSIFAIIGEELGLLGAGIVVIIFVLLTLRILKIAKAAPDNFGRIVAIGVASWIFFQAFVNIAAVTAIMPLTGISLPFISYGGTSLIFLMAAIGLLLNISKQSKI